MWLLRALGGSVLWLLAGLLGLVGVLLCVTLILMPLGIPVLMLARKLFGYGLALYLPRKVRHPAQELGKSARGKAKDAKESVPKPDAKGGTKAVRKKAKKGGKKVQKLAKKQRKRLS